MSDYEKLKKVAQEQQQAVVVAFKKNRDVLIYVNPDASDEEVSKSLMIASVKVVKERFK